MGIYSSYVPEFSHYTDLNNGRVAKAVFIQKEVMWYSWDMPGENMTLPDGRAIRVERVLSVDENGWVWGRIRDCSGDRESYIELFWLGISRDHTVYDPDQYFATHRPAICS